MSEAEDLLAFQLKAINVPFEREVQFAKPRRWRAAHVVQWRHDRNVRVLRIDLRGHHAEQTVLLRALSSWLGQPSPPRESTRGSGQGLGQRYPGWSGQPVMGWCGDWLPPGSRSGETSIWPSQGSSLLCLRNHRSTADVRLGQPDRRLSQPARLRAHVPFVPPEVRPCAA